MAKTALTTRVTSGTFINGWKDNNYRVRTNQQGQEYIRIVGNIVLLTKEKNQTVKFDNETFHIER